MKVALTGGVASGKSMVAQRFRSLGVSVADSDQIAREVVRPGTAGYAEVVAAFGSKVVAADRTLDRKLLRDLIFSDPAQKLQLESIVHPRVLEALWRTPAGAHAYVVLEIPLLIETGMQERVDRVLVVDCPTRLQIQRLVSRDGISREQAQAMLAAQLPREQRLAYADDLIVNDGDPEPVFKAVAYLHDQYNQLAN